MRQSRTHRDQIFDKQTHLFVEETFEQLVDAECGGESEKNVIEEVNKHLGICCCLWGGLPARRGCLHTNKPKTTGMTHEADF
jgi:hypothetical protein